jgi:CDP-6-deoxy-D-xylo-4-hexulose-3-dehydrase
MNKDFSWPLMHDAISREDKDGLINFINEPNVRFTNGLKVREFEALWSKWLGVSKSIFVNSGASANDITMMALAEIYGVGEVIVPPLTWVSDISSVLKAGHKPIFVDINQESLAIDSEQILKSLTSKTKAIFLTHVLGLNALTNDLLNIIKEMNIILIEDVCESHGAIFNEKKVGTFGLASNFSFYFAHHMTTIEGGMISTNDDNFYDVARMMRSHGLVRESPFIKTREKYMSTYPDLNEDFIFAFASHNMRSTELNAVLGISQLSRLDSYIEKRRSNFQLFLDNLDGKIFQTELMSTGNSNYAFILILREKSFEMQRKVEKVLNTNKVEFRRGLAGGGNQLRQPYLKNSLLQLDLKLFPVVEHIHFFSWYIGNNPSITSNQIIELCQSLSSDELLK